MGQLLKLPPHQQHTAARFGGKNTNKRVLSFAVQQYYTWCFLSLIRFIRQAMSVHP